MHSKIQLAVTISASYRLQTLRKIVQINARYLHRYDERGLLQKGSRQKNATKTTSVVEYQILWGQQTVNKIIQQQINGSSRPINGSLTDLISPHFVDIGYGLSKIIHLAKKHMLPIPIIEFGVDDIVRSDICAEWVKVFMKEGL